ncbi:MAG TPA: hypothetical protein VEL05_12195, partial [Candidatus Acidoferrum sp.]|nr:hypothetical protein [Candidatus Acidoferrum sp.]
MKRGGMSGLLSLGLLAAAACQNREEPARVTVSSPADAHEAIVDQEYRFRWNWPGSGWKLLREADARKVAPDAIAAAVSADQIWLSLIVESAPGLELESYARMVIAAMTLADKETERFERIQFAGQPAVRTMVRGTMQATRLVFSHIIFLHDGFAYQLVGWSVEPGLREGRLQPALDAFSLLEGKVTGRSRHRSVADTYGVGWRVRRGAFESGATGLAVRPRGRWNLLVGDRLARLNPNAEVGLTLDIPGVYVLLLPERAPAAETQAYARAWIEKTASAIGGEPAPPLDGQLAGDRLSFRAMRVAQTGMEYLLGAAARGDLAVGVMAWFAADGSADSRASLADALAAVEIMPPDRIDEVRAELARLPDPENVVGPGFSLRRGVYRSFEHDFRWKKPSTLWRLKTGDAARADNPAAALVFTDVARGLMGLVIVEDKVGSSEEYHRRVAAELVGDASLRSSPRPLGREVGQTFVQDFQLEGMPFNRRVVTVADRGRGYRLVVWGAAELMGREQSAVEDAIDGFALEELDGETSSPRRHIDNRLGFALDLPEGSWTRKDMTPDGVRGVGAVTAWESGHEMIMTVAMCTPARNDEWFLDFMEQMMRDRAPGLFSGRAERSD